jgi:hypothetical protein
MITPVSTTAVQGREDALEIEAADGTTTFIRFKTLPTLP